MRIRIKYIKDRNPHVDKMRFRKQGAHVKSTKASRRKQKVEDKKNIEG